MSRAQTVPEPDCCSWALSYEGCDCISSRFFRMRFNVPSSDRAQVRLLQLGIAVGFYVPSSHRARARLLQLGIVVREMRLCNCISSRFTIVWFNYCSWIKYSEFSCLFQVISRSIVLFRAFSLSSSCLRSVNCRSVIVRNTASTLLYAFSHCLVD